MNPVSQSLEQPVKELMDLNVKALQSLTYMMPTELLTIRKPEEVMEKNMQMFIDNSHAALAYMHNMFDIMERHWLKNVDSMLKGTKDMSSHAKPSSHTVSNHPSASTTKKAASKTTGKTAAKTAKSGAIKTSSAKSKSLSAKSASAKKQPVKHAAVTMSKDNTIKSHSTSPEAKHANTGSPHMASAASHIKPMDNKNKI